MSEIELLFDFSRNDDVHSLTSILEESKLNACDIFDERQNSLCHYAAANNSKEVLKYILSVCSFEYINSQNESGNTPLHWASLNGNIDIVKDLLGKGCDPQKENGFGATPMDEAMKRGFTDLMQVYCAFLSSSPSEE